jgi:hypothetical protein
MSEQNSVIKTPEKKRVKINWKKFIRVVSALVLIVLFIYSSLYDTRDLIFSGNEIVIQEENRDLDVSGQAVILEAVSLTPFMLVNENGELIAGQPVPPPFSWSKSACYVFGPTNISEGKWTYIHGDADIKIYSQNPITVRAIRNNPLKVWGLYFLFALYIYLLGIFITETNFK